MIVNRITSSMIWVKVMPATTIRGGAYRLAGRRLPNLTRMAVTEEQARAAILELLGQRDPGKTICPSEAARALGGDEGFRPLMPLVRDAARAMVADDEIDVTQKGEVVDLDEARGPIRLRLR